MKTKKNNHNNRLNTASDVLQSLLTEGKSGLVEGFQRWRLWRQWPQVVGPELAKTTNPVGYQNGTLIIWVDHPARIQDLHYVKDVLIQKVNDHLGRRWVYYLKFTTDRKSVPSIDGSDENMRDFLSKPFRPGEADRD